MTVKREHLIGAIFLIAGTCVGAGMLGLPIEAGESGFLPAFIITTCAYLFMMITGLLLVEANLWMEEGVHYNTMAYKLLGKVGKHVTTILYLFMGYGSLIAYASGGSILIQGLIERGFSFDLLRWEACLVFGVVFGLCLGLGARILGRINTILVSGMIVAYVLIVFLGVPGIDFTLISRSEWAPAPLAIPLLLATFSYQMILPSLTSYLKRDHHAMRKAVIFGTTIPYVAYVIWVLIVLGIVPYEGEMGLKEAFAQGVVATTPLRVWGKIPFLSFFSEFFGFFALITSFFGIGLGTFDFLADLTRIEKRGFGKIALLTLTLVPTLLFSVLFPEAFYIALDMSGGFGDAILSCFIPIAMVWVGRYIKRIKGPYTVFGGKPLLVFLAILCAAIVYIQVVKLV